MSGTRNTQPGRSMILSSRAQPPRALKDFPPPRPNNRSNLSVKQFLLSSSPLPSPALPALIPRHGKKPPPVNTRRALRILSWLAILTTVYYLASFLLSSTRKVTVNRIPNLSYLSPNDPYDTVSSTDLPDYPTPIGVVDKHNRQRWTVSIPSKLPFPLQAADYADICAHIPDVATHMSSKTQATTFLDVDEAQKAGILPQLSHPSSKSHLPICDRTLIYVLDGTDAGLGSTLMGLWLSYALAKRESRSFFIDDRHFAYGQYSTYFMPPATPKCRPPPTPLRLPCPPQAKHLVVSAATHPWIFGKDFSAEYTMHEIFSMAREGYEALFHLRTDDAEYVAKRIAELRGTSDNKIVGIHSRRGDRHPFTLAYSRNYLPSTTYSDAATALTSQVAPKSSHVSTILASDDPELYADSSPLPYSRAQGRITLASKSTLGDGSIGWEGGFFAALFWNLGLPAEAEWQKRIGSPLPSRMVAEMGEEARDERDFRTRPTKEAVEMRELIGRAYLLDLAVLGQADGVVCAVSSYTCRLLGVMMGEKAVKEGRWANVEEGYPWLGIDSS